MENLPGLMVCGMVFLVLVFVGAVVAMFVSRRSGKSKERPEPERAEVRARPQRAPVAPVQDASPPAFAPVQEVPPHPDEIMRIVCDEQGARVLVEVEGEQYAHIREIRDADVGKRVLWAIVDLIRFTGGMAANPEAVRSAIGTQPPPAPRPARQTVSPSPAVDTQTPTPVETAQPAVPAPASRPAPPVSPPTAGQISPTPLPETQPERQGYSLVGFFRRGLEPPQGQGPAVSGLDPMALILELLGDAAPDRYHDQRRNETAQPV